MAQSVVGTQHVTPVPRSRATEGPVTCAKVWRRVSPALTSLQALIFLHSSPLDCHGLGALVLLEAPPRTVTGI